MEKYILLKTNAEIKKREDCCVLIDRTHGKNFIPIHPSEALILSLLDGKTTIEDILFVIQKVYRLSEKESKDLLEKLLIKVNNFIQIESSNNKSIRRYNPLDFLYNCNEDYWNDKPLLYPVSLLLLVTNRCNFKCRYCFRGFEFQPIDLDFTRVQNLIEQASGLGVKTITISGGEPFLYPNIIELISTVIKYDIIPCVITNGSLLMGYMDEILNSGLESLQISLDAPTEEVHDYITQTKHTFNTIVLAIENLKSKGVWVRVKSVMTSANCIFLPELIDLLFNIGVDDIDIAIENAGGFEAKNPYVLKKLNFKQIEYIQSVVQEKSLKYKNISIKLLHHKEKWLNAKDIIRCGNLFHSAVIHPTGKVTVCEMIENVPEFTYGNINENTLNNIWNGERHINLLSKVTTNTKIHCNQCENLNFCKTGCFNLSKIQMGDFFAKDPRCLI